MTPDSSSSQPTTRLDAAARRESILDAAEMQFVRDGLHATGTRDLARAAGVTEPVLYRHFESKEALFVAVVIRMLDQGIQDLARHRTGRAAEAALQRSLEAVILVEAAAGIPEATEAVRSRLQTLETTMASGTGHPSRDDLHRKLGETLLSRFRQD